MKRQRARMPLSKKPDAHSVGQRSGGGGGGGGGSLLPAFLHPASITFGRHRTTQNRHQCVCMVDHFSSVGIPMLDMFKGVVIGPTINEIAAALAGGTVGVMGTIIVLETGRQKAKERKQCPYCRGTGKLPCAKCYTLGAVPAGKAVGAQEACNLCHAGGYLKCNHCEGEGRLIPIEYERAIRAQYEDYVYDSRTDDYYQDGPPYV